MLRYLGHHTRLTMTIFHRIPDKYLWRIPSLYFMGLGAFCFLKDISGKGFDVLMTSFYILLPIPFVLRSNYVNIVAGSLLSCVFGYLLIALTIWFFLVISGEKADDALRVFGIGYPFLVVSFLAAFLLVRTGINGLQTSKTPHCTT